MVDTERHEIFDSSEEENPMQMKQQPASPTMSRLYSPNLGNGGADD